MRENRKNFEMRNINIIKNYLEFPEGSVLIEIGKTKIICNVSVEDKVPNFLRGTNKGWLTAEYSMLPRATNIRNKRESSTLKQSGRTLEIQRLIGRSLRSCLDLSELGDKTIIVDCDVIQADGGTRTASITGAYIALELAIERLIKNNILLKNPIKYKVAAISVGKVNDEILLDLEYSEDSIAEVDMNIVMNDRGELIEIQGTGEDSTFSQNDLFKFLEISKEAFENLFKL